MAAASRVGFALFWLGDLYTYSYPRALRRRGAVPVDRRRRRTSPSTRRSWSGCSRSCAAATRSGDRAGAHRRADHDARPRARSRGSRSSRRTCTTTRWTPSRSSSRSPTRSGDILLLAAAIRLAVDGGQPRPGVLPPVREHRRAARHRLRLRRRDAATAPTTARSSSTSAGSASTCSGAPPRCTRRCASSTEPAPERAPRLSPIRLALLTVASLIAPAVEIVSEIRRGDVDLLVIVARVGRPLRPRRGPHGRPRAPAGALRRARARAERAPAPRSSARPSREEIYAAAMRSADELVPRRDERVLRSSRTASCGSSRPTAARPSCSPGAPGRCDDRDAARPGRRPEVPRSRCRASLRADLGLGREQRQRPRARPHPARAAARRLLVVAGDDARRAPTARALRDLATQVSLALEQRGADRGGPLPRSEARFGSLVQPLVSDLITVLGADGTDRLPEPVDRARPRLRPRRASSARRFDALLRARREQRGCCSCWPTASAREAGADRGPRVLRCATATAPSLQFEILYTNLLDDEHVSGIVLNAATSASARPSRSSSPTRPSTTRSRAWPTARCSASACATPSARAPPRAAAASAVVFLDLDDFKTDQRHRSATPPATRCCTEVAKRLERSHPRQRHRRALRRRRVRGAARGRRAAPQEAADTAERVLEALPVPLRVEQKELVAARQPRHLACAERRRVADAEELIRNADAAMYIAKRDGKGGYRLFEPRDARGRRSRASSCAPTCSARMVNDQLELHYQPVVRLDDGSRLGRRGAAALAPPRARPRRARTSSSRSPRRRA